ncbi:MAG: PAS domain S-box protein [Nitrospirae bacterium]|nr:PAS domain S-box protein [Nitrospirota bacterium]
MDRHFQGMIETAVDAILTLDDRGYIKYCNNAAGELFGYTRDELVGRDIEVFIPRGLSLLSGQAKINGSIVIKKDGSKLPIEITGSVYKVDNRSYYMAIVRNNTCRQELLRLRGMYGNESETFIRAKTEVEDLKKQKELILRQQEQIFELYVYSAHTLKNYLSTIITFFDLLKRRKNKPEKLHELLEEDYIDSLDFELKSMYELLVSVLKSTTVNNVEENDLNVCEYIKKNLLPLRMGKKSSYLKVQNDFPCDKEYYVRGIAVNLNTVLRNVFNNARDEVIMFYGPWDDNLYVEGNIAIDDTETAHIIINGYVKDNYVKISVSNLGRLVPDDRKEVIFEKGVTFKSTGTGYGLSDCRKIISEMGGKIWAEDFYNKGTTFCIQIPLANVIEGGDVDD